MALSYDEIDTHVRERYIPVLQDQYYTSNPLVAQLSATSRVTYDSGPKVAQPVLYGEENSGWYSGLDPFNIDLKQTTTLAKFGWKGFYVNVTIDGDTIDEVEGDQKVLSIVESKMMNAGKTADRKLEISTFVDQGSKALDTLTDAIAESGTYGEISKTTNTWWRGNVNSTGGAFDLSMVQTEYGNCSDGNIQPNLILTTQAIFNKFWLRVQPAQQGNLENTPGLAQIGYTGIKFNKATVVVCSQCPSGHIYLLNTDYWKFVVHKNKDMYWTPPKTPINQDAFVRQLLWKGILMCVAPRWQGQITNVS